VYIASILGTLSRKKAVIGSLVGVKFLPFYRNRALLSCFVDLTKVSPLSFSDRSHAGSDRSHAGEMKQNVGIERRGEWKSHFVRGEARIPLRRYSYYIMSLLD
jgi:hypothetical protein